MTSMRFSVLLSMKSLTGFDKEEEEEEEIPAASAFTQPVSRPSARVQTEEKPRYQELEEDDREGIPSFFSRR